MLFRSSQVIMKDYKPDQSGEIEEIPVDLISEKMKKRFERKSQKSSNDSPVLSSCGLNPECERPQTPDYEDLNKRFQNLLCNQFKKQFSG